MTYTAMPMLIDKLSRTSYTTIVFVLGGGVGLVSTHLTRRMFRSQDVNVLNSIRDEKMRGAIHMTLLVLIGLLALALRL
jgi:hypothetical protein